MGNQVISLKSVREAKLAPVEDLRDPLHELLNEFSDLVDEETSAPPGPVHFDSPALQESDNLFDLMRAQMNALEDAQRRIKYYMDEIEMFVQK